MNDRKLAIDDRDLKETINGIEKCIKTAQLVIFDDISSKGMSDYEQALLYSYVEYRTSELKSSIYTSNALPDDMYNIIDYKIADRIVRYSYVKQLDGGSSRAAF